MKNIYFLFLLITGISFQAQDNSLSTKKLLQVNTYNGGQLVKTIFDTDGNHISVGFANGTYTFMNEIIPTVGVNDLYIIKTDKNTGEKIWIKTFNSGTKGKIEPSSINIDSENNIYIAAIFKGEIQINGQIFSASLQDLNYKGILLKFNNSGNLLWGANIDHNIFTTDSKIEIENQNIMFFNGGNIISLYNKDSGQFVRNKTFTNLNISEVHLKNNQIYIAARTSAAIEILGKNILQQNEIIVRTDLSFSDNAFLRFFPQTNPNTIASAVRIQDILVNDDNSLFYSILFPSGSVVSAENHLGIIINGIKGGNSNSKHLWLGKSNSDLTAFEWFYGSAFSSSAEYSFFDGVKLYAGRNGNINFITNSDNSTINYRGEYISFQERGMVSIKNDGTLISYSDFISSVEIFSERQDITLYLDNNDIFASWSQSPNSFVMKKAQNEANFSSYKSYNSLGFYGYLRSRELFKVYENGEIFNSYITDGKIFNYFGQDNEPAINNNIISKISSNGNLEWKIKADGILDNYVGYWLEGHRMDINASKEVVSVFSCYKDYYDVTPCKITDSQGISQEYYGSSKISKFNNDGSFQWSNFLGYGASWPGGPLAKDISTYYDNLGNVIVVGKTSSTNIFYGNEEFQLPSKSFFILKLDPNGNKMFFKYFPYSTDSELFTRFDNQNNIYVFFGVENQTTAMNFDSVIIPQNGENTSKFVMLKMNPQGNVLSGKNFLSNNNNSLEYLNSDVKFDGENFILYGSTYVGLNLQNQPFNNPYVNTNGYSTTLISKINTGGEVLWSNPFCSSDYSNQPGTGITNHNSNNIDFDSDKNIYIVDFWRQALNYKGTEIPIKAGLNGLLFKIDGNGNYVYHKYTDRPESNQYISVYGKDKVAVIGNSYVNFILDKPLNDLGNFNNYILFLEKEELATQESEYKKIFSIYPNPSSDFITINAKEKINSIEIYDSAGRKVYSEINSKNQIDVRKLLKGVYYIRINMETKSLTSKFIKN
jgi:hypothetical protein